MRELLRDNMEINHQGHLVISGCDVTKLAAIYGTPLYILDEVLIRRACREYVTSFAALFEESQVLYAGKAFLTTGMCQIINEEGLGLDVVSGGELYTALASGFPKEKIFFHGNNKSPEEIDFALEADIGCFVVDNLWELELLNQKAKAHQRRARVLLRITPGVEAHTHVYVQTGQLDSKFGFGLAKGVAMEAVKRALAAEFIDWLGLHCHIGSQILDLECYSVAVDLMFDFMAQIKEETGREVRILDLGGGLGIRYTKEDQPKTPRQWAQHLAQSVQEAARKYRLGIPKICVEPGRSIVGPAGSTLYTIGSIKHIPGIRTYVAVDGGMSDNPRVALYDAKYEGIVANKAHQPCTQVVSVAGKCCESGDMLIWDLPVPEVTAGDLLAVFATGAYNFSMASNYNRLLRPPVVLVNNGTHRLLVRGQTYEDLIDDDLDLSDSGECSRVS